MPYADLQRNVEIFPHTQIKEDLERVISSSSSPQQALLLKSFQSTSHQSICHLPVQVFRGLQHILLEGVIIWW